jgi:hypothetical protein
MGKKLKITEKQLKTLKENLLKEDKFSWDGKYANEEDINEHHDGEFPESLMNKSLEQFLDELSKKSETDYDKVEDIIAKHFATSKDEGYTGLPSDLEVVDEDNKPTDAKSNQWFSDSDGERVTDGVH